MHIDFTKENLNQINKSLKSRLLSANLLEQYLYQFNLIIYKEVAAIKSPLTNSKLRFDFYIKEFNLFIEFDGYQHFIKDNIYHDNNDEFAKLQLYDQTKNQWCINHDFNLIRLPYTLKENDLKWISEFILNQQNQNYQILIEPESHQMINLNNNDKHIIIDAQLLNELKSLIINQSFINLSHYDDENLIIHFQQACKDLLKNNMINIDELNYYGIYSENDLSQQNLKKTFFDE